MRKIRREVTRKIQKSFEPRIRGCHGWNGPQTTNDTDTRQPKIETTHEIQHADSARLVTLTVSALSVVDYGCFSSQSFWKAGSERNGSQIGSSLRRAGVTPVGL